MQILAIGATNELHYPIGKFTSTFLPKIREKKASKIIYQERIEIAPKMHFLDKETEEPK
jgi:hypothetical protein